MTRVYCIMHTYKNSTGVDPSSLVGICSTEELAEKELAWRAGVCNYDGIDSDSMFFLKQVNSICWASEYEQFYIREEELDKYKGVEL